MKWRYELDLLLEGTERQNFPQCLEAEELSLFARVPREAVYRAVEGGRFRFSEEYDARLDSFPSDLATMSIYLDQVVRGLEVREGDGGVQAWKIVARRGEWVRSPLAVGPGGAVDPQRDDVAWLAAHWREYPRWFQDGMSFQYPELRKLPR